MANKFHDINGMLLVGRGYEVTHGFLERVQNLGDNAPSGTVKIAVRAERIARGSGATAAGLGHGDGPLPEGLVPPVAQLVAGGQGGPHGHEPDREAAGHGHEDGEAGAEVHVASATRAT